MSDASWGLARPRVVVSACLLGVPVRWDGGHRRQDWIAEDLARVAEVIAVCPEDELGLGVPRPPIQIVRRGAALRLERVEDAHDLSEAMDQYASSRLAQPDLGDVRGFVLKARSPSCGWGSTPVIEGQDEERTHGRFAQQVAARFPNLPVVDETVGEDELRQAAFLTALHAPDLPDAIADQLPADAPSLDALRTEPRLLLARADESWWPFFEALGSAARGD